MRSQKYQGLISNCGSEKRSVGNEALKIPGAHLKSRKRKTSGRNKPSKRLGAYTRMKIHKANGSDKIIVEPRRHDKQANHRTSCVIQNLMNKSSFELSNIVRNPCEDDSNKWEQVKLERCTNKRRARNPLEGGRHRYTQGKKSKVK
jgi:hypothetical protein